jgi:hypothetical protein
MQMPNSFIYVPLTALILRGVRGAHADFHGRFAGKHAGWRQICRYAVERVSEARKQYRLALTDPSNHVSRFYNLIPGVGTNCSL